MHELATACCRSRFTVTQIRGRGRPRLEGVHCDSGFTVRLYLCIVELFVSWMTMEGIHSICKKWRKVWATMDWLSLIRYSQYSSLVCVWIVPAVKHSTGLPWSHARRVIFVMGGTTSYGGMRACAAAQKIYIMWVVIILMPNEPKPKCKGNRSPFI